MSSYNKGEWSELYVFLKLLADGVLYAADENLKRIPGVFYPILKILRTENLHDNWEYILNGHVTIVNANTQESIVIDTNIFQQYANVLLDYIKNSTGSSFSVDPLDAFMQTVKINKIKASSHDKRDITIVVHDQITGNNPELGFSIKSNLGADSTLFNPSKNSNFIYRIMGQNLKPEKVAYINSISTSGKVRDRLNQIQSNNTLEYCDVEGTTFKSNLQLIDTRMPEIIAAMLLISYSRIANKISHIIKKLEEYNPLSFDGVYTHPMYKYKIKNLLTDIALGMTAAKPWDGIYDATGGFIIVDRSGDVLCYHIYNRNEFQEYLINKTYLDTPSTGRYDFGQVYEVEGEQYFKLNLQIRYASG